jgi:Leucine-rich repeat (LRR) protein
MTPNSPSLGSITAIINHTSSPKNHSLSIQTVTSPLLSPKIASLHSPFPSSPLSEMETSVDKPMTVWKKAELFLSFHGGIEDEEIHSSSPKKREFSFRQHLDCLSSTSSKSSSGPFSPPLNKQLSNIQKATFRQQDPERIILNISEKDPLQKALDEISYSLVDDHSNKYEVEKRIKESLEIAQKSHMNAEISLYLWFASISQLPHNLNLIFGHIVALELSYNQLKELPTSFGKLTKLEKLNLSFNHFEIFPSCIAELPALKVLKLEKSQITTFPSIAEFKAINLEELNLGENKFSQLPSWLNSLTKLKKLFLQGNRLSSSLPSFTDLRRLEMVNLSNNGISKIPEATWEQLCELKDLKRLDLRNNHIIYLPEIYRKLPIDCTISIAGNCFSTKRINELYEQQEKQFQAKEPGPKIVDLLSSYGNFLAIRYKNAPPPAHQYPSSILP